MFYRVGNVHRILPDTAVPTEDLPSGFYDLRFSSMAGFSIDKAKPFPLPSKTYGDVVERADRCITTFFDRAKQGRNTGMMLKGEKGSGKSLLAKITAAKFVQDHGGVVLNIDQPFEGSGFIEVLNNIHRPTIVLCDEFEKVYKTLKDGNENEHSAQEGLLSIMDGGTVHNKLFIFTVNDVHKVNEFLKNRPGRIYYDYEYSGLNDTFIEQFLNDALKEEYKPFIEQIMQLALVIPSFNFDMLQAIVEEINRYGDNPASVVERLNIDTGMTSKYARWKVEVFHKGVNLTKWFNPITFEGDPLRNQPRIHFFPRDVAELHRDGMLKTAKMATKKDEDGDEVRDYEKTGYPKEVMDITSHNQRLESENMIGTTEDRGLVFADCYGKENTVLIVRREVYKQADWATTYDSSRLTTAPESYL